MRKQFRKIRTSEDEAAENAEDSESEQPPRNQS
jgi:hypothetical protein